MASRDRINQTLRNVIRLLHWRIYCGYVSFIRLSDYLPSVGLAKDKIAVLAPALAMTVCIRVASSFSSSISCEIACAAFVKLGNPGVDGRCSTIEGIRQGGEGRSLSGGNDSG